MPNAVKKVNGPEAMAAVRNHPASLALAESLNGETIRGQQQTILALKATIAKQERRIEKLIHTVDGLDDRARFDRVVLAWLHDDRDELVFDDGTTVEHVVDAKAKTYGAFVVAICEFVRKGIEPRAVLRSICHDELCREVDCLHGNNDLVIPQQVKALIAEARNASA